MVNGSKPYPFFETSVLKLLPQATKKEYGKDWKTLFSKYNSLTAKEFAELSGTPRVGVEEVLDDLVKQGNLKKLSTKNGAIWTLM